MQDFRPRSFNFLPDVIKNLLIINGLLFLATFIFSEVFSINLVNILGLHDIRSDFFRPYQFITHMFMHSPLNLNNSLASMMHILFNMFSLWMFGSVLENLWGPKRFLFFYFFTGLGAALIHSGVIYYENSLVESGLNAFLSSPTPEAFKLFINENTNGIFNNLNKSFMDEWSKNPNNEMFASQAKTFANQILQAHLNVPVIGASGAVFGVLLAFGMLFPNTLLYIYFLFPIKAKYVVAILTAVELYRGYGSFTGNLNSNIAHFAHLGGMLFAFILIKYWQKDKRKFY